MNDQLPPSSNQPITPFHYIPSQQHLSLLYNFSLPYIANHTITVQSQYLQRIFVYLCTSDDAFDPSEEIQKERQKRQTLLLSLLQYVSPEQQQSLISSATIAHFWLVVAELEKQRKEYSRVISAYLTHYKENNKQSLKDDSGLFEYIYSLLNDTTLSSSTITTIRSQILQRLPELVKYQPNRTARLIVECFTSENERIIQTLSEHPDLQYAYMRSIMTSQRALEAKEKPAVDNQEWNINSTNTNELSMTELLERSGLQFTPKMHELYMKLLCIYNPGDVLSHLSSHHDYNIETMIQLCQQYSINDACAYLLERTGDVQGAMELTLRDVVKRVEQLKQFIFLHATEYPLDPTFKPTDVSLYTTKTRTLFQNHEYQQLHKQVLQSITTATLLCQRSMDSEKLWFSLLDRFVQLQRTVKNQEKEQRRQQSGGASSPHPAVGVSLSTPEHRKLQQKIQSERQSSECF